MICSPTRILLKDRVTTVPGMRMNENITSEQYDLKANDAGVMVSGGKLTCKVLIPWESIKIAIYPADPPANDAPRPRGRPKKS